MNFNNGASDTPDGVKPAESKSNDAGEDIKESHLDHAAMESATKAQKHQHENENTNSSNTIFSK